MPLGGTKTVPAIHRATSPHLEETDPAPQSLSQVFTGPPLPWKLECGEQDGCLGEFPSPLQGQVGGPDTLSWQRG